MPAFARTDVVLSYCESRMIDGDGHVLAENYLQYVHDIDPVRWRADYRRSGTEEIAEALAIKNTIPNVSAAVFRRATLANVLRDHLDEMAKYRNVADWLCYIRLLERGGSVAFTARSLNNHRRHARSITIASSGRRHLDEIAAMQATAADVVEVRPEALSLARRYHASIAEKFGLRVKEIA